MDALTTLRLAVQASRPRYCLIAAVVALSFVSQACTRYRVADNDGATDSGAADGGAGQDKTKAPDGSDTLEGSGGGGGALGLGGSGTGAGGQAGTGGVSAEVGGGATGGTIGPGQGGSGSGTNGTGGVSGAGGILAGIGGATCLGPDFPTATDVVTVVAFSPSSKLLASGSRKFAVRLWNLDGSAGSTIAEVNPVVTALAFSPDGTTLAIATTDPTVSPRTGSVNLWRTSDWTIVKTFKHPLTNSLAFSPDGVSLIAAPGFDGTVASAAIVWDVAQGNARAIGTAAQGSFVSAMALSADGQSIVTVGTDALIQRWRFDGTFLGASQSNQTGALSSAQFSPDGASFVTAGSLVNQLETWKTSDGSFLKSFNGIQASAVAFVPDGTKLAVQASGTIETIRIADAAPTIYSSAGIGNTIAASTDGMFIAAPVSDGSIQVWCLGH